MKVRFWGVRGSIACPGPETMKFGGNTISLELRFEETDRLIMIDAGTGIRQLGNHLMKNDLPKRPITAEIFITHTHWDHILGFPFFTPIYNPKTKLKVYGPVTHEDDTLDKIVSGLLLYRYFPIQYNELAAEINYHQLGECEMDLGDGIHLKTKYLNHPILCLGYRFEYKGKVLCTAYDTEPFRNIFPSDPNSPDYDPIVAEEGEAVAREENKKVQKFFQGADLLIHDSQYTPEEYRSSKTGWGHSSFEDAVNAGIKAEVKKIILIHHDPDRTDNELVSFEKHYREFAKNKSQMEVFIAKEGMEFEI